MFNFKHEYIIGAGEKMMIRLNPLNLVKGKELDHNKMPATK